MRISLPCMTRPISARAGAGAEVSVFAVSVFLLITCLAGSGGRGRIKNPRPFPAVGDGRNYFYVRQARTASPGTTTTRTTTCPMLPNMEWKLAGSRSGVKRGMGVFPGRASTEDFEKNLPPLKEPPDVLRRYSGMSQERGT